MSETSRAIVFDDDGQRLELRRYPLPKLAEGVVAQRLSVAQVGGKWR